MYMHRMYCFAVEYNHLAFIKLCWKIKSRKIKSKWAEEIKYNITLHIVKCCMCMDCIFLFSSFSCMGCFLSVNKNRLFHNPLERPPAIMPWILSKLALACYMYRYIGERCNMQRPCRLWDPVALLMNVLAYVSMEEKWNSIYVQTLSKRCRIIITSYRNSIFQSQFEKYVMHCSIWYYNYH